MINIKSEKTAIAVTLFLAFMIGTQASADVYDDAVADSIRPAEDTERDAGRRPADILRFFEVSAGQTVVDLSSGGGYYTRPIASIVGSDGKVIAQNGAGRMNDERKAGLEAMYATYGNIEMDLQPQAQLAMPDNSVDAVFAFLIVHHWHFNEDQGEMTPSGSVDSYANILRMLKPGGTFGIIEHLAPEGLSREASAALHRAPAATIKSDLADAGFVLAAESDLLADHPEDDISAGWGDGATPRGQTQRFVHLYRKPAN
ncbi:MAG: class I SAM-dependent methyltransferase [Proteobacteria bacterium]|jgi:predicted methyltransferase|nr:class I SAM-dependent methyltransferase [Pseudomonadota bacterium]